MTQCSYFKGLYTIKPSPVHDLDSYIAAMKKNLGERGRIKAIYEQMMASKSRCTERIPRVAATSLPTLSIFGTNDPDFPAPNGPELEAKWIAEQFGASSKYEMVEGAGHFPHVERPELCAKHIFAFIESNSL